MEFHILEKSIPFFFKEGNIGVLLIHGFTGTPNEMKYLGEFLAKNGITSMGILLPGHGTDIKDLLKVKWLDWDNAVKESLKKLEEICDKIFLIGLSMGGTLALHQGINPDDKIINNWDCPRIGDCPRLLKFLDSKIKGIVIMNTPVFKLGNYLVKLVPILKYIIKYAKKKGKSVKDVLMEQNIMGYNKHPLHGVAELLKLMKHVKNEIDLIKVPVLIMHSKLDPTVSWKNAEKIYKNISSIDKEIIYFYNSYHVLTMDNDKDEVFRATLNFIKKWT